MGFLFLIINITDRNKTETEGLIQFSHLLCKKCVITYVITGPTSTLYCSV